MHFLKAAHCNIPFFQQVKNMLKIKLQVKNMLKIKLQDALVFSVGILVALEPKGAEAAAQPTRREPSGTWGIFLSVLRF